MTTKNLKMLYEKLCVEGAVLIMRVEHDGIFCRWNDGVSNVDCAVCWGDLNEMYGTHGFFKARDKFIKKQEQ